MLNPIKLELLKFWSRFYFRYGFTNGWNPTTLFILNLALSDMLYCAVNLPLYSLQYLKRGWILGPELCYANAVFRYINAFSDWMSLAMIAVSRCVCLKKPRLIEATKTKTIVTLVIAAIWFYSILLISPLFPEGVSVFEKYGAFTNEFHQRRFSSLEFWNFWLQLPQWKMWLHLVGLCQS